MAVNATYGGTVQFGQEFMHLATKKIANRGKGFLVLSDDRLTYLCPGNVTGKTKHALMDIQRELTFRAGRQIVGVRLMKIASIGKPFLSDCRCNACSCFLKTLVCL